jgi:hypothetical protein
MLSQGCAALVTPGIQKMNGIGKQNNAQDIYAKIQQSRFRKMNWIDVE